MRRATRVALRDYRVTAPSCISRVPSATCSISAAQDELMKIFHCDHCQLIFFESSRCVSCDHPLAYLPDLAVVGSLRYWGIDSSGCD